MKGGYGRKGEKKTNVMEKEKGKKRWKGEGEKMGEK